MNASAALPAPPAPDAGHAAAFQGDHAGKLPGTGLVQPLLANRRGVAAAGILKLIPTYSS